MARRKKRGALNPFGLSFMDVLSNTIGGLAFLLIILFLLMSRRNTVTLPQILTESLPDAYCNSAYYASLSACRGGGVYTWQLAQGQLPEGLVLDPGGHIRGVVAGIPTIGEDGEAKDVAVMCTAIKLEAQRNSTTREFRIRILPQKPTPTAPVRIVSERKLPDAYGGQPYPLTLASQGGAPPYEWRLANGQLPETMELQPDGRLTGTPLPSELGAFSFTASVAAGNGSQDVRTFTMEVVEKIPPPPPTPPLRILTDALPDAIADRPYPLFPAAEGGLQPYSWRIVAGRPPWLRARGSNKAFAGIPTYDDVGDYSLILEVTDSEDTTLQSEPLDLIVIPPGRAVDEPLEILTDMLPTGVVERDLSFYYTATGGYPPYTWTCRSLPADSGLTFADETGHIAGVPGGPGTWRLDVTVTDSSGDTDVCTLPFTVVAPDQPLRLRTASLPTALTDSPYQVALAATGGHAPYRWQAEAGPWPAGLELDAETGRLDGVPTQPDIYAIALSVTDAHGQTAASGPIEFRVLTKRQAPKLILKTADIPLMVRGRAVDIALACEGGLPPYSWTMDGEVPDGIVCVEGAVRGEPLSVGTHSVRLRVTDSEGQRAEVELPIEVERLLPWWVVLLALIAMAAAIILALRMRRRPPLRPLTILTEAVPNARASFDYTVQLACDGGRPPYTWSVVSGELPPGLELREDGLLSGKPFEGVAVNEPVDMSFEVQVRDALGRKTRKTL